MHVGLAVLVVRDHVARDGVKSVDPLTLKDLLTLNILGDATILAGQEYLDQRRVDWVSVIEIPVEDFVRQDELVLTTAIGCGDDPSALRNFVEEVHNAGAAALAIALGRHLESVPESVVAIAQTYHFPLVAIPWDVRFADISRRVYSEIALRNSEIGRSGGFVRPMLLQVAQEPNLDDLMATLARGLGAEVAFFDGATGGWWGSRRISALCREDMRDILPQLVVPRDAACEFQPLTRIRLHDMELGAIPMCSDGRWLGTLVVHAAPLKTDLFEGHTRMIRHLVALAYLEQESVVAESLQRQEDLAWKLAKGEFKTWDDLLAGASGFQTDVIQSYVAVVGTLDNWDNTYRYNQTVFSHEGRSEWEADIIQTVRRALAKKADTAGYRMVSTFQRGEWIGFAFSPRRIQRNVFHDMLTAVEEGLNLRAAFGKLSWGMAIGEPGVDGFHQAYQNARTALDVGIRRHGPGGVHEYERISHERLLIRFLEDAIVRSAVQATLGSLVEYDRQHEADMINTLAAYLQNRTNVSVTARRLHLHRQSLLYRLKKIEMLTGRSLDDADDLFLLELCVRLLGLRVAEFRPTLRE